jgi:hypothetical protein
MKPLLWLGLLLPVVAFSAESMKKRAVLFLPDQIECKSGDGASLSGEVGFRWDEDTPLYLSLWANPKTGRSDRVFGSLAVFDENGRELNKAIYVTLPLSPDDQIVVKKGDVMRFGLYEMYSTAIFQKPGNYYAVAHFSYGISGMRSVDFTTNKRWFKVVEAPPKKSSL